MSREERQLTLQRAAELVPGALVDDSEVEAAGRRWRRLLIKTHVIRPGEDIVDVVAGYAHPFVQRGDIVCIGQKAVSIAQRRLVAEDRVRPRPLARVLSRFVSRSPYGYGLRKPQTMEVALREAGTARILLAATLAAGGRLIGRHGDFFRVAGWQVGAIDGTTTWTLPPYNRYIVLAPRAPDRVAARLALRLDAGAGAAIVDLNDVEGAVLGASAGVDRAVVLAVLRDNPMGQGPFQTPLCIVRPLDPNDGRP